MRKTVWEIETCPNCGGLLLDEEHTDPDGTPNGWYCMECDEREFEPQTARVIDSKRVAPLLDALGKIASRHMPLDFDDMGCARDALANFREAS